MQARGSSGDGIGEFEAEWEIGVGGFTEFVRNDVLPWMDGFDPRGSWARPMWRDLARRGPA